MFFITRTQRDMDGWLEYAINNVHDRRTRITPTVTGLVQSNRPVAVLTRVSQRVPASTL